MDKGDFVKMLDNFKFYYKAPDKEMETDILYTAEKLDNVYLITWFENQKNKMKYPLNWVENALNEGVWVILDESKN